MSESNKDNLEVGQAVCEMMVKDIGARMALCHLQIILEQASAAAHEGCGADVVDKYIGSAISIVHALRGEVVTDEVRRDIGAGFH